MLNETQKDEITKLAVEAADDALLCTRTGSGVEVTVDARAYRSLYLASKKTTVFTTRDAELWFDDVFYREFIGGL